MKRIVLGALRRAAARWPRVALWVAHPLAAATYPLGRGAGHARTRALFPQLGERELRAAHRRARTCYVKDSVLDAARPRIGRGFDPPTVPRAPLAALASPAVLVSLHSGPFEALGPALETAPGGTIVIQAGERAERPGLALLHTRAAQPSRTLAFARAVKAVRGGASAFVLADAFDAGVETIDALMLDRTLSLARGPFALARLAGVPLVPVVARWKGTAVEVELGDPIDATAGEAAMAHATAAWFDRYFRAWPGDLSSFTRSRLRPSLPGR